MEMSGRAYFVRRPRTAEELHRLHLPEQERPFEVVQTVHLGIADYENFVTDLLADRQFIEDYALQCDRGKAWRCLLVRGRGQTGGILVSPEGTRFVGWAAWLSGK